MLDLLSPFVPHYLLIVKPLKLHGFSVDLPAILGQDDLHFGCPPLHLLKGFPGEQKHFEVLCQSRNKRAFHIFRDRDKFKALCLLICVTSHLKGVLIRLVQSEKNGHRQHN